MKKILFLLFASFSICSMETQDIDVKRDLFFNELVPDEILVLIFKSEVSNYICLFPVCNSKCPKSIHIPDNFDKALNFLKNIRLVCKGFYRCTDELIWRSIRAHNPQKVPLIWILRKGNYNLAKYLLNSGANPNICNLKGRTPLVLAIQKCENFELLFQSGLLNLMLCKKVDVNAKDEDGYNVVLAAILKRGSEQVLDLLCDHGLKLNALIELTDINTEKKTPLGWALFFNASKEIIQVLLDKGADINGRYDKSQSIIQFVRNAYKNMSSQTDPEILTIFKLIMLNEAKSLKSYRVSYCSLS